MIIRQGKFVPLFFLSWSGRRGGERARAAAEEEEEEEEKPHSIHPRLHEPSKSDTCARSRWLQNATHSLDGAFGSR